MSRRFRKKHAVLGEYNKSPSSPFLKLNEALHDTAFVKHTYKHTTIGFLADVKDMPNQYAYSKVFFDRWYRPENCTLIVTGDVKHDDLVSLAKQYYGSWNAGAASVAIPEEPSQLEPKSASHVAVAHIADFAAGLSYSRGRSQECPTRRC